MNVEDPLSFWQRVLSLLLLVLLVGRFFAVTRSDLVALLSKGGSQG